MRRFDERDARSVRASARVVIVGIEIAFISALKLVWFV